MSVLDLPSAPYSGPALGADDALPAGPYRVSMTWDIRNAGWTVPYTVRAADGRVVAGHIPSQLIAEEIAARLNRAGAPALPEKIAATLDDMVATGPASYRAFLESKFHFSVSRGFTVEPSAIHPWHKPHVGDVTRWGLSKGRAAYFVGFGLHKTSMQLETMRLIRAREGGRQLIVVPLGVRQEFKPDAVKIGMTWRFIRSADEIDEEGLYLTNYESVRDGKLDVSGFNAVSLDEAAILRGFGTKTYQTFVEVFADTPYRFVATATPAPNQYRELINYAGFLGVTDTGLALTRFFKRDSESANDLTLYPHMETEYYAWLHSWACFLQRPSDLGYSDEGYELPPINVRWHEVPSDMPPAFDRDGQGSMVRDSSMGLQQAAEAKRLSIPARIEKLKALVEARPGDHALLWHDLEAERKAIKSAIPDASEIYGSLDLDEREKRILAFQAGETAYLATKPELNGAGCNFQHHCHWSVFAGITHKFHDFIQAIHRVQRFGQTSPVDIDIIYSEAERPVRENLERKWADHDALSARMSELVRRHGLSGVGIELELARTIGVERAQKKGELWTAIFNDVVDEARTLESNSLGLIVTSPPFSNQFEYTETYEDFGHVEDNLKFFQQMDFLTPNLYRALKPGRVMAVHVKDRIRFGNVTGLGMPMVEPFHAECIDHYRRHGFIYCGMITIVTDVVRENAQTYRLGWTECCKDGSKMSVGLPEYLLIFRKLPTDRSTAFADERVVKSKDEYSRARWQVDAHAYWRSSGNRLLTLDDCAGLDQGAIQKAFTRSSLEAVYDYEAHVALGEALEVKKALSKEFMTLAPGSHHPEVWHDVHKFLSLNGTQWRMGHVLHVCPMQFDVADRAITRWSNPGDLVFDPFAGLFTVPSRAVRLGRRGMGVELNPDYWRDGVGHCIDAERDALTPSLFDILDNKDAA